MWKKIDLGNVSIVIIPQADDIHSQHLILVFFRKIFMRMDILAHFMEILILQIYVEARQLWLLVVHLGIKV